MILRAVQQLALPLHGGALRLRLAVGWTPGVPVATQRRLDARRISPDERAAELARIAEDERRSAGVWDPDAAYQVEAWPERPWD